MCITFSSNFLPTPLVCLSHSPNPLQRKPNQMRVICSQLLFMSTLPTKSMRTKWSFYGDEMQKFISNSRHFDWYSGIRN